MLQVDPAQQPRLQELEANALKRLDEAKQKTWLGEVAALEESLRHIREKQVQATQISDRVRDGLSYSASSKSGSQGEFRPEVPRTLSAVKAS
jgi:hypothetical protein